MTHARRSGFLWSVLAPALLATLVGSPAASAEEARSKVPTDPPERSGWIPERDYVWRGSISVLLHIPAVRDELKLPPELYEKIKAAQDQAISFFEMQQVHRGTRNANQDWQEALRSGDEKAIQAAGRNLEEARAIESNADSSRDEATRSLLTRDQSRRLFQIFVQQEGARALLRPDVAERLGLSDDQRLQLREVMSLRDAEREALVNRDEHDPVVQKRAARVRELVEKSRDGRRLPDADLAFLAESWERGKVKAREFDRLEERADGRLMKVLTRYQRQGLNRLRGPDFELRLLTRDAQPMPNPTHPG